jgi:hypothetical protein
VSPALRRRLPLLVFVAIGVALWRGAFGWLPSERTVVWRLPVAAQAVRQVELQIWEAGVLLKQELRSLPNGLTEELASQVPLARGNKQALAIVTLSPDASQVYTGDFDPGSEPIVVVRPSAR